MDAPAPAPSRIALARRSVPLSYHRRRLGIGSSGTEFRSTTASDQPVGVNSTANTTSSPILQDTTTAYSSMVELVGYRGAIYYADIRVGSRFYNLIVDTGSTDTWISCYVYDPSRCVTECPGPAIDITYGSGKVCVTPEYERVKLGNLVINNYAVGIALNPIVEPNTDKTGGILLGPSQGILGLGYPALASFVSVPGYFVKFLTSFSVYLAPQDNEYGSFLMLDGVDSDVITENGLVPYRVPLKQEAHWTLGLTGFHVDGYAPTIVPCAPPDEGSCNAIIDTGTTYLVIPPQVFETFVTKILVPAGCYESDESGSEGVYICGRTVQLPTLQFSFGVMNFFLEMEDYIQRIGEKYVVEIQPTGSLGSLQQSWVIGGAFLKRFYSSYEVSRAVVFFCVDGVTCNQNGSAGMLPDDAVLVSSPTGNGSVATDADFGATTLPAQTDTATGDTTNVRTVPRDTSGNGTIVSTTSSSGNDHALTITIIASLAGVAFVVLVVLVVRKLYRKRENREQERLAELEMDTIASSGVLATAYDSGAALSPSAPASVTKVN